MLAVWLGQMITEEGIGNGVSIIIFGGIIAAMPQHVQRTWVEGGFGELLIFVLVTVFTVAVIVFVQEGQRRIPVQYGKRVRAMRGNRLGMAGGQSTHVPLRVNSAGMIPLIFASVPDLPEHDRQLLRQLGDGWVASVAKFIHRVFSPRYNRYWILYFVLVIGFTYFYTDVVFRQQNLPETLQKQGGFIPGIRPGPEHGEISERGDDSGSPWWAPSSWASSPSCRGWCIWSLAAARAGLHKHAVDFQHGPADRGGCGAGHDEAARSSVADAAL